MRRALGFGGLAVVGVLALGVVALIVEISLTTPVAVVIGAAVATLLTGVAALVDLDDLIRAISASRLFLPILAYLLTVAWVGSARGSVRFDEVGAQVIAVLALALAIDVRFFRLGGRTDRLEVMSTLFVMLLLGIGELYALRGVFSGQPHHGEIVAAAIAVGFTAVGVSSLVHTSRGAHEEDGGGAG
jgi:hypothetical protein